MCVLLYQFTMGCASALHTIPREDLSGCFIVQIHVPPWWASAYSFCLIRILDNKINKTRFVTSNLLLSSSNILAHFLHNSSTCLPNFLQLSPSKYPSKILRTRACLLVFYKTLYIQTFLHKQKRCILESTATKTRKPSKAWNSSIRSDLKVPPVPVCPGQTSRL